MYFDSYITLKLKPRAGKNNLINEGFRQATLNCCKSVQRKEFLSDLTKLLNNQDLPSKSKLLCLAQFVDQEGVLRVSGRLRHSSFTNDKKHPILLPKQHHITKFFAKYLHITNHGSEVLATQWKKLMQTNVHALYVSRKNPNFILHLFFNYKVQE